MDYDQEWVPEQYTLDPDDIGFGYCDFCGAKVYVAGENKSDALRHEERCEWR